MELHEKYETLMKRGMPKIARLEVHAGLVCESWTLASITPQINDRVVIGEADAADILTMHALRWWLASNDHTEIHARAFRGLDPSERDSVYDKDDYPGQFERHAGGEPYDDGKGVGHNYDTLLDAILAATSHLEK